MEIAKAFVVANTVDLTESNFHSKQTEVKEPMLIVMAEGKELKSFRLCADSMEDLKYMDEHKLFVTYDVPKNQYFEWNGAYFIGAGSVDGIKEERAAVTDVLGFNDEESNVLVTR